MDSTLAYNGVTMNNRANASCQFAPYYFIEVVGLDGMWNSDISYEAHKIPGTIGDRSGDVFRGGKSLTISGWVWGLNMKRLREGQRAMQQAFADKAIHNLALTMVGEEALYFKCRVSQDLSMIEQQPDERVRRPFVVTLRADDPRSYKVSDNSLYPSWQA